MDYDDTDIVASLLDRVKNDDHSSFEFIRSLQERAITKQYLSAALATADHFNTLKNLLVKEYCLQLDENKTTDIEALVAIRHLDEAVKFYNKEAMIMQDCLDEYRAYIFGGHLFENIVLNSYRKDEDCVDFRKLPWRLF